MSLGDGIDREVALLELVGDLLCRHARVVLPVGEDDHAGDVLPAQGVESRLDRVADRGLRPDAGFFPVLLEELLPAFPRGRGAREGEIGDVELVLQLLEDAQLRVLQHFLDDVRPRELPQLGFSGHAGHLGDGLPLLVGLKKVDFLHRPRLVEEDKDEGLPLLDRFDRQHGPHEEKQGQQKQRRAQHGQEDLGSRSHVLPLPAIQRADHDQDGRNDDEEEDPGRGHVLPGDRPVGVLGDRHAVDAQQLRPEIALFGRLLGQDAPEEARHCLPLPKRQARPDSVSRKPTRM
jgi:hypothetical protein